MMLTLDFLFAIVLILGFSALTFILTFTLSMASVVQYITFTAARNYQAAHLTNGDQEDRAKAKFAELVGDPVFKPLFKNGWFVIDPEPTVGDHAQIIPGFKEAAQDKDQFWGAGTSFTAKVLDFQIPFFGSTTDDGSGGTGFKTYIGSYLGREPSTKECMDFNAARWTQIRTLGNYSQGTSGTGYYPMADDGC